MTTETRTPDFGQAKALLEEVDLPTADLTDEMLQSFVGSYLNGVLVAMGGLEIYAGCALLRSLATAPGHRASGLAGELVEALEEWHERAESPTSTC